MVGRAPLVWRGNNGGRRGPAMAGRTDTREETRCREVRLFLSCAFYSYTRTWVGYGDIVLVNLGRRI